MIDYLFYRLSRMKIHKPAYWAKIFVPVLVGVAFLPACLTLLKYFWGCYDRESNDGTIKFVVLAIAVVLMMITSFYYSPNRIRKLNEKYSAESGSWRNLKLIFSGLLLAGIFLVGSAAVRYFVRIPEC